ncbi:hypothetical protein ANANG_G00228210 [Anguilla anguilla]|uniref:Endoplasmic reticulum transmembrane protein n=1 Tax=Anguilla anguilla TaxID=7936 RepID=A0A9D3M541_ANGAN|nr:hypothetical protein ANANG_G00228210 [Anguilla anguilla]
MGGVKLQEKLRDAGIDVPEAGKKPGASLEEENKTLKTEVKKLKDELDATKKVLHKSDSDVKAMRKQAENLTVEYDRLLDEHAKLQASVDDSTREKKTD